MKSPAWADLAAAIGGRANKKLDHNTYAAFANPANKEGPINVSLHGHVIAVLHPDGWVTLDSCGFRTPTTKDRMNKSLPRGWRVGQTNHIWYMEHWSWVDNKHNIGRKLFQDGVMVHARKGVKNAGKESEAKKELTLIRRIRSYAKAFADLFIAGKIPPPSAGDCWHCSMHVSSPGSNPELGGTATAAIVETPAEELLKRPTLGDVTDKKDHLLGHMKERYYVPSLLANAASAPGAPMSRMALTLVGETWKAWPNNAGRAEQYRQLVLDQLTKTLVKYISRRLGTAAL